MKKPNSVRNQSINTPLSLPLKNYLNHVYNTNKEKGVALAMVRRVLDGELVLVILGPLY